MAKSKRNNYYIGNAFRSESAYMTWEYSSFSSVVLPFLSQFLWLTSLALLYNVAQ